MDDILLKEFKNIKDKFTKKIASLELELNGSPSDDFFKVQDEFKKLLDENKGDARSSKELMGKLSELSSRNDKALKKMKRFGRSTKMIDEKIKYDSALYELNNIIFFREKKGMK